MCGRFVQASNIETIAAYYRASPDPRLKRGEIEPNYNVAPTQIVLQVTESGSKDPSAGGTRIIEEARWGFVYPWARSLEDKPQPINARIESVLSKAGFKEAFLHRRSVVPADGFYEWKRIPGSPKQPWYLHPPEGEMLSMAAIWSVWRPPEEGRPEAPIVTCALITVPAQGLAAQIHDRMPALLDRESVDRWLSQGSDDPNELIELLLRSSRSFVLEGHPVSRRVNNPAANDASLVEKIESPTGGI